MSEVYCIDETYRIIQHMKSYKTFCVGDVVDIMMFVRGDLDRKKASSAVSHHLQRMAKQGYIEVVRCTRRNGTSHCYEYRVI